MKNHAELIRQIVPLWYAEVAWAKQLLVRAFQLNEAEDILRFDQRGCKRVPGSNWFVRTHGIGVDVFKAPGVGGVDFDFDKTDPDAWRLGRFFEKQINDGTLPYGDYQELVDDEGLLIVTIKEVLGEE